MRLLKMYVTSLTLLLCVLAGIESVAAQVGLYDELKKMWATEVKYDIYCRLHATREQKAYFNQKTDKLADGCWKEPVKVESKIQFIWFIN